MKALVPEGEVVRGHGQLAGCEHPAAALLGRDAQGAEGVTIVGGGVGLGEFGSRRSSRPTSCPGGERCAG